MKCPCPPLGGLRGKLLLFFLLVDLATISVLVVTVSRDARDALEKQSMERLEHTAYTIARDIEEDLSEKWEAAENIAAHTLVINGVIDSLGRDAYLRPFLSNLKLPGKGKGAQLSVLDFRGRKVAQNQPSSASYLEAPWLREVLAGKPYMGLESGGENRVLLAFPILYHQLVEGVLVADFDFSFAEEIAAGERNFGAALLSGEGRPLLGFVPPSLEARKTKGLKIEFFTEAERMYAQHPVHPANDSPGEHWELFLSTPVSAFQAPVVSLRRRMISLGSLSAGVIALLILWRTELMVRPLRSLERTMEAIIAGGDLSRRVVMCRKDEIGSIGRSFNQMMDRLEEKSCALEQAYEELQRTQAQMLQSEKMASIGQLAAGVAHEINNPMGFIACNLNSMKKYLARISAFLEAQDALLASSDPPETQRASLAEHRRREKIDYLLSDAPSLIEESLEGAERVSTIVQSLKSFCRLDEAHWQEADLNHCLETTLNIVWNELKYKTTVHKDYGEGVVIACFPNQLNQVFTNLLINASQAIEEKGEIRLRTWKEAEAVHVAVSDTGKGIPAENLSRIFEPFYTTKVVGEGTGLGLSIAYNIVQKHQGRISVESEVNRGTTFTVSLPFAQAPQATGST